MKEIMVKDRQTLGDIALKTGGRMEYAMAIAEANGLSVTSRLRDGMMLVLPEWGDGDRRTVELYGAYGVDPATEVREDELAECPYGGIGYMGVGVDFEVS